MAARKYLVIGDLRGGRNGSDPPLSLATDQCVEAVNVDFWNATLAHKRPGAASVDLTYVAANGGPFTGYVSSVWSSYGDADFLCAVDSAGVKAYRKAGDTGWRAFGVTATVDAIAGNYQHVHSATFNGKCFVAADTAVDRMHVFENATPDNLRRVGLATPAIPSAADQGSGSLPVMGRYYKVAWTKQVSGVTVLRSELSPATGHTSSGSGATVRVTRPTAASEGETHWELWAGATNTGTYYLRATTAIATTTYDDDEDNNAHYATAYGGIANPLAGTNTVPTSWKYVATNGQRLLGAGGWESGAMQSRVWFTPVLGSSDVGDDERVPTLNYVDLDTADGDDITGMVGNWQGNTIVFKRSQVWKLVPTGNATTPYSKVCLTKAVGCLSAKSIVEAEDEGGNPAIYWLSERGPFRMGNAGIQYCGRDIEDLWATVNKDATGIVGHGVFHGDKHQVWFYLSTGSGNYPDLKVCLDTRMCRFGEDGVRKGWVRHTGPSCTVRCSVMYAATYTAAASSYVRSPYVGSDATTNLLLKADTGTQDGSTNYQGYVTTKPYAPGGLGFNVSISQSHLAAAAQNGVTITQTIVRDYGLESRTSTCLLTAAASETRVQRQLEGSDTAGAGIVQFTLGDASAANTTWTLDALMVPYMVQEER